MKKVLWLSVILFSFNSCKVIKSLREMSKKEATIYSYNFDNKEVKYLPMHHLGKQEFYDDVKNKVQNLKSEGFVVYYELLSSKMQIDSLQKDIVKRKFRKIRGFSGNYADAIEGTPLEKYVPQPSYSDLGTSDTDIRADIDVVQFINEWERLNGNIVLDSLDYTTSFSSEYKKGSFYTNKQYESIVIDYRNRNLVDLIKSNGDKKILILYGEGHRKDFQKKLRSKK